MSKKELYKVPVMYPNNKSFERIVVASTKEEAIEIVKRKEPRNLYDYSNPEREVTEATYYGTL